MVMPSRSGAVLAVWAQSVFVCSRSVPNEVPGGAIRSVQPVWRYLASEIDRDDQNLF